MNRFVLLLAALATVASVGACTEPDSDQSFSPTETVATEIVSTETVAMATGPPATAPDQAGLAPNATVERIVDGDTLVAVIDGERERVRLLGIDTPESVAENRPDQCYGKEASDYLASLLPEGAEITLVLDEEARDQYDRLLAYVIRSADDLFVNLDLVERGYADVLIYDPNDHYESLFRAAEADAIDAGAGLWSVCGGPDVPLE
ncbi:MAG: thermonuclease family protein [Acidimicrobiales bacterium]